MEFSRPEYWSGEPFPSPADLPNPGTEPRSPALQADSSPAKPQGKPFNEKSMSKRGTQQAGASNKAVSSGENGPAASNRHGIGQEAVGEAGGPQAANGNRRQRDRAACQKPQGSWRRGQLTRCQRDFHFFTQVEILGDGISS